MLRFFKENRKRAIGVCELLERAMGTIDLDKRMVELLSRKLNVLEMLNLDRLA